MKPPSKQEKTEASPKNGSAPLFKGSSPFEMAMNKGFAAYREANPGASLNDYLDSPDMIKNLASSTESDSMPSSAGIDDLAARYPWVKPEVWETPMTSEEFKRFVAMQEETLKAA